MKINGNIIDASGFPLPLANVYFSDKQGNYKAGLAGTTTNNEGEYTLEGEGNYITASYTGYVAKTKAAKPGKIDFELSESPTLPQVEIKGTILWPRILAGVIIILTIYFVYQKIKQL